MSRYNFDEFIDGYNINSVEYVWKHTKDMV